jgi:2Fe-2S ferredoxin
VIVREGGASCNEASDPENDQLDNAPGLTPKSRLGCQCVPDGTTNLVVEVPDWNRNLVREAHH